MKVIETIHHGNYRNVRVVELPDRPKVSDVQRMMRDCPYSTAHAPALTAIGLRDALESGGSYSYGWVDWEVQR